MRWLRLCFITTYLLIFNISSAFAEADVINKIIKLYHAGQINDAYKLAEKHLLEAGNNPAFDYHYAIAAIDSGHISQGLFALKRILALHPDDQSARLELARGYFLLKQYDRARQEFIKVLDSNPPAEVKVNINQFMDAIRLRETGRKTTTGLYMELGLGYDSNVSSAPSAAGYTDRFGIGTLQGASLSMDDNYSSFATGVTIHHPLKPGVALFGDVNISQRSHEDISEFNIGIFDIQSGLIFSGDQGYFRIGMEWQNYEIGHDRYREMIAMNGELSWQPAVQTRLTGFLQLAGMKFLTQKHLNSRRQMGGAGFQHVFAGGLQPVVFGSLYGGAERARDNLALAESAIDRDIYGLSIGNQLTISPQLSLDFTVWLQKSRYLEDNSFFLIKRKDEYRNYSLGITYRPSRQWAIRSNLGYTEGRSNIEIYKYYRAQVEMSIRYEY
ncbi:MAG: tetratricopeptide repeat protein [Candidatus Polarisedimenticolaceae bacterium]|nr:tetratricopeptide repeat protein [Candidatus Polarisedimenticolaceae bacterium]